MKVPKPFVRTYAAGKLYPGLLEDDDIGVLEITEMEKGPRPTRRSPPAAGGSVPASAASVSLALGAARQQQLSHARGLPDTHRADVRFMYCMVS